MDPMKQQIKDFQEIMALHEEYVLPDLLVMLTEAVQSLPIDQVASARFQIDIKTFSYDDTEYPQLVMSFLRPETDAEEAKREAQEQQIRLRLEARDLAEFKRLQTKFKTTK